jgi:hypothetical protein
MRQLALDLDPRSVVLRLGGPVRALDTNLECEMAIEVLAAASVDLPTGRLVPA